MLQSKLSWFPANSLLVRTGRWPGGRLAGGIKNNANSANLAGTGAELGNINKCSSCFLQAMIRYFVFDYIGAFDTLNFILYINREAGKHSEIAPIYGSFEKSPYDCQPPQPRQLRWHAKKTHNQGSYTDNFWSSEKENVTKLISMAVLWRVFRQWEIYWPWNCQDML